VSTLLSPNTRTDVATGGPGQYNAASQGHQSQNGNRDERDVAHEMSGPRLLWIARPTVPDHL